ncbi:MAG: carbon-nitrogen hydrolase family protein, partial [Candidatus Omnitrophica bacterium]|nr:carbon-nitrogen hydrolase family protein [Candidatus Omnitrophota bacterium]
MRIYSFFLMTFLLSTGMNTVCAIEPYSPEQLKWNRVRVAAVQMTGTWNWHAGGPPAVDPADKVVEYIDQAGEDGAELIVFPELLLGYFKVPNPTTDKISEAAKRNQIYVIAGCFEIVDEEGTYHNSTLIFDREGEIIGRHFKVHQAVGNPPYFWPPKPYDAEWKMKPGDRFEAFDLDFGRVGIVTCYDGYFPESFRSSALNGSEIICWVNARGGSIEDFIVKSAMYQNQVCLIATNKAVGSGTMIGQWPTKILESIDDPEEGYIVADLHLAAMRHSRKNSTNYHSLHPEAYTPIREDPNIPAAYENLPPLEGAPAQMIELTPDVFDPPLERKKGMKPGTDLYHLAFRAKAGWMEKGVLVRLPEIFQTNLGWHFIDHYQDHIWPMNEPDPFPQWEKNATTGEVSYELPLPEGITFGARAVPDREYVELEMWVTNRTDETLEFAYGNPCLNFGTCPSLNERFNLKNLYAYYDGKFQSFENTTPTPEEVGRDPWILFLTEQGVKDFKGEKISPTWYRVDQVAEMNLMGAADPEKK